MTLPTVRLANLATVSSGGGAPQDADAFSAEGVPFVRAGSLIKLLEGQPEESLELLLPDVAAHHGLKIFPAGTVLFAKSGMSATKGHVYQLKKPAYVVNHLAALIPKSEVTGRYLRHVLKFKSPTCLIKDEAYPSIRLGDIENMEVPAPKSKEERKRIAAILDQAEELRRKRQHALGRLNEFGQAIFIEMFGDPLADYSRSAIVELRLQEGWSRSNVGAQLTLQRGVDITKNVALPGDIPVISSGGVSFYHTVALVKAPGVLLGRKGSVGKVHYAEVDYWPHDTTLYVKDFKGNNPKFIYHFFGTSRFPGTKPVLQIRV